jgi:murein DD-endopeptidase MepM/ murein hydrolase activator NlpD
MRALAIAAVLCASFLPDEGASRPTARNAISRGSGLQLPAGRRFGAHRSPHRRHKGIDLGKEGDPVRAFASGVVTALHYDMPGSALPVAWHPRLRPPHRMGRGGLMVFIRHDAGYETRYMHLAGPAPGISVGCRVQGGQWIAVVGRTGIRSSPGHLHFEIRSGGRAVDPWPTVASLMSRAALERAVISGLGRP